MYSKSRICGNRQVSVFETVSRIITYANTLGKTAMHEYKAEYDGNDDNDD